MVESRKLDHFGVVDAAYADIRYGRPRFTPELPRGAPNSGIRPGRRPGIGPHPEAPSLASGPLMRDSEYGLRRRTRSCVPQSLVADCFCGLTSRVVLVNNNRSLV